MENAVALKPVTNFPVKQVSKPNEHGEFNWLQKIQLAYGVRTMANSPQTPSIPLNVTTIGTWVVIIAAVLGGFWWSFTQGREIGRQEQTIQQLSDRLQKAEQDAAEAKKFQVYNTGAKDEKDGHAKESKK